MTLNVYTPVKCLLFFIALISFSSTALAQCTNTDSTLVASVCSGDTFNLNGHAYTQSNTYLDTVTNAGGCDSIITLNLTVIAPIRQNIYDTICTGDSVNFNGHTYTTSGSRADTLTAVTGCDSIVILTVYARPVLTGSVSQSICHGGAYDFNGVNVGVAGVYKDTLTTAAGCDSVVTLTLSYTPDIPQAITRSICQGQNYIFYSDTLTYSGVYYDTLIGSAGCDSVVELTLDILPNPLEPFIVGSGDTLTSSAAPIYQWFLNGSSISGDTTENIFISQGGDYQVQVTGPNGCSRISASYFGYPLSVNKTDADWGVKLYPNPNNGLFEVSFADNLARTLQVTDALGNVIVSEQNVIGNKQFNLTEFAGGVYFARIKQQGEVKTLRFVVAK